MPVRGQESTGVSVLAALRRALRLQHTCSVQPAACGEVVGQRTHKLGRGSAEPRERDAANRQHLPRIGSATLDQWWRPDLEGFLGAARGDATPPSLLPPRARDWSPSVRSTSSRSLSATPRQAVSAASTPRSPERCPGSVDTRSPGGASFGWPEISVLYASPLALCVPLTPINVQSEIEMLHEALQDSSSRVRLSVGVATSSSLSRVISRARGDRQGLLLHLSAHVVNDEAKGVGLVLEDAAGAHHVIWREELEESLGARERSLEHVSLVFLSTCWSEDLAQVFIESGVRHVIAVRTQVLDTAARRFAHHFYFALGYGESLLAAWEGARQALRIDPNPKIKASADLFVLFGQYGAESATLESLSRVGALEAPCPLRGFEDASLFEAVQAPLPNRVEDFLGRAEEIHRILRTFEGGRRACVVHGPPGVGKTALCMELAHFAGSPGRLFSYGVAFVRFHREDLLGILEAAEEGLEELAASLQMPLRPASGSSIRSSASTSRPPSASSKGSNCDASSVSSGSDWLRGPHRISEPTAAEAACFTVRSRLRRGLQQL